uniref:Uncharacterized protein n=1 Tax=Dunaliella tertiolecta TaxID=3047 RepID=A0A7S3VMC6_DUNTE
MCLLATNNNDEHFNSVFKGCGLDIPGTWTRAGGPGVGRGAFGASSGNFLKVGVKQGVDDSAPAPSSSGPMPAEHFMKALQAKRIVFKRIWNLTIAKEMMDQVFREYCMLGL